MEITLDFSSIIQQSQGNPFLLIWVLIKEGAWIIFLLFFIWVILQLWLAYIRNIYRRKRKYILLAIDVPRDNIQTPRGAENIFHHLAGAHATFDLYTKWWEGEIPDSFSLEIISLEGYIQFLIHTVDKYRDLIEASIYAQYPDAEIVEVEDYTKDWNITFPNEEYDLWGTEIRLAKKYFYPIKTHPAFEDPISKEHKDPMAAMMEALGKIGPGEQVWLQLVVTPADNDWGEAAKPLIQKLIGGKVEEKQNIFDYIYKGPIKILSFINDVFSTTPSTTKDSKKEEPNKYLYLTQGEKDIVSAIEKKISKLGFHVRFRFLYLAKKEVFDKNKASKVLYGSIKQFNTLDCNAFKPHKLYMTGGIHFFKNLRLKWRKNKILRLYKDRAQSLSPGDYGYILNTEELASVYHFPPMSVKAPLIKKTEAKKAEPPLSLPVEESFEEEKESIVTEKKMSAPDNLPLS